MDDTLEEYIKASEELLAVLAGNELSGSLSHMKEHLEEQATFREAQLQDARKLIKSLSVTHSELERKGSETEGEPAEQFDEKVEKLCHEKASEDHNLRRLKGDIELIDKETNVSISMLRGSEAKKERLNNELTEELPVEKHSFELYTQISHIRWDYASPHDEVKGYVSSSKDAKPFSVTSNENSNSTMANMLWDLIDSTIENVHHLNGQKNGLH